MGSATAHLHKNAATVPIAEFDRPVWNAESILLNGHAHTDPAGRAQLGTEGTAALEKITERITPTLQEGGKDDRGRIHGDLHRENMIAMPGGGIGIIDFDDCGTGHYLLDLATVLSSIHRIAHTEPGAYERFAHAFLVGYSEVRPLPADFAQLLEPYLLLRDAFILNFVTAAAPVNADVASWGPRRIAGITANMRAYLDGHRYPGALTAAVQAQNLTHENHSVAVPSTAITVRACAVILEGRQFCLIYRQRPDDQYSLPGGLVHTDEEVPAALARELEEELDLDLSALPGRPELRWVQDQLTTRPGSDALFRRLHLIHVLHVPARVRHTMAATEQDAEDDARIVWKDLDQAASLHLYPAVGEAISALVTQVRPAPVLLPPITDRTYRWR